MQRLEVSGAVRPIYGSLGVKRLKVRAVHFNTRSEIFPQNSALSKLIVFSSCNLCVHLHHCHSLPPSPPHHNSVKSPVKGLFARAGCCLVLDS